MKIKFFNRNKTNNFGKTFFNKPKQGANVNLFQDLEAKYSPTRGKIIQSQEPFEPEKFKFRATAKDIAVLKMFNSSFESNAPDGQAQFVCGDEDGEVKIYCDNYVHSNSNMITPRVDIKDEKLCFNHIKNGYPIDNYKAPGFIEITDNTNGKKNTYKYVKLSEKQKQEGLFDPRYGNIHRTVRHYLDDQLEHTFMTKPYELNPEQFSRGKDYYILVSVSDENGNNIELADHAEVYELNFSVDKETGTYKYDLIQEEGMDGSGLSSIDYDKRK